MSELDFRDTCFDKNAGGVVVTAKDQTRMGAGPKLANAISEESSPFGRYAG